MITNLFLNYIMRKITTAGFFLFITLLNSALFSQSKQVIDLFQNHNLELPEHIYQIQDTPQHELDFLLPLAQAGNGHFTTPVSGLGLDGRVEAVLASEEEIIVAGEFLYYDGEIQLNRIAKWNGNTFEPLGEGFNGGVSTLVIYNNELIAAGSFTRSGETDLNRIARWTGQNWVPLGDGLDNIVLDLIVYNGELIAAGGFLNSGITEVNNIASWDGKEWNPLGSGVQFDRSPSIGSLAVYDDKLITGGEFSQAGGVAANSIASWNGTSWESLNGGFRRQDSNVNLVSSIAIFEGDLIMSGFYIVPESYHNYFSDIMRWDGTEWSQVGASIPGKLVLGMDVFQERIVTVGSNVSGDPGFNSYLTTYDGSTWNPDFLPVLAELEAMNQISALDVEGDRLFLGGEFRNTENKIFKFAYLQNNELFPQLDPLSYPVPLGTIYSITTYNNEVIIGGLFDYPDEQGKNLLRYSGQGWDTMNAGFAGTVTEIIEYDGYLVAAGESSSFNEYGNIAQWDGTRWEPVGDGLSGYVEALAVFEGNLIAAGQGLIPHDSDRFAVWDGQEWGPLFENPDDTPGLPFSMVVHNGELYAGGSFYSGDFSEAKNIARWSGKIFEPVGDGFNANVLDLSVYDGELVASGSFTKSGDLNVPQVARWDGEKWNPFGEGFDYSVNVLEDFQGDLIAGGNFFQSGETITPGIARWNGEEWLPLGSGVRGSVRAIHADGTRLHIGGSFREAGNKPALNYTIWNEMVTSTEEENKNLPAKFSLHQNSPNPFNPVTIISFDLPRQSDVQIEVFNTLGQRVELLQDGVMNAGRHTVSFDAGNLASGIYLYRLSAGGFSQTKLLTLVK